jgi:hypothetical protein
MGMSDQDPLRRKLQTLMRMFEETQHKDFLWCREKQTECQKLTDIGRDSD